MDEQLDAVRGEARRLGVPDAELAPLLALLTATARVAQLAVTDALYPGVWAENDFQRDVRDRLRAVPTIGADLEEHAHAAGGVTDLSFHSIRLELKVDASRDLTVDDVASRYGQQTAQYVSASGRRCGVLVCLDTSAKTKAPGLVRNDVGLRTINPASSDGHPIVVGVIVVRGNLAKPSALSKGASRSRRRT